MPYEGEYAHYQPLKRIVESERVQQLLRRSRILERSTLTKHVAPAQPPDAPATLPSLVLAIDGSYTEVDVRNGYPGAKVGYCSVASVIVNLTEVDRLDVNRPISPVDFRKTEQPSSDASALPGCNVITRDHTSARDSFREALFELLHDAIVDEEDHTRLLATYQALLAHKPTAPIACPYSHLDCARDVSIGLNIETCPCSLHKPLLPSDALRIHERFNNDSGTNGEAFGYVMQVWERLLLIHLLRCFEQRDWLPRLSEIAFFLDGPLAVFGPPAWLSAAIRKELERINTNFRSATNNDLIIVGIEKSGNFVTHFEELDKREDGTQHFLPRTYFLPTDRYEALPEFFRLCFSREVLEFLVAARRLLRWRRCKTDWTMMALLMVELHGKRENALSNQMRQTKAMSPDYAVTWWRERSMRPPKIDPVEFMLRKIKWRYAKGRLCTRRSRVYLGDSRTDLSAIATNSRCRKAKLLFTSPPYYGVTNYFYDQWLRLWLLGGDSWPRRSSKKCQQKFDNKSEYVAMLQAVFSRSRCLLARDAVIVVRTDNRKFTYESTLEALEKAFPKKRLRHERHTLPEFTQTELFDADSTIEGEVDFTLE